MNGMLVFLLVRGWKVAIQSVPNPTGGNWELLATREEQTILVRAKSRWDASRAAAQMAVKLEQEDAMVPNWQEEWGTDEGE